MHDMVYFYQNRYHGLVESSCLLQSTQANHIDRTQHENSGSTSIFFCRTDSLTPSNINSSCRNKIQYTQTYICYVPINQSKKKSCISKNSNYLSRIVPFPCTYFYIKIILVFREHTLPNCSPHLDRKSTRLNSSHSGESRMPSSA